MKMRKGHTISRDDHAGKFVLVCTGVDEATGTRCTFCTEALMGIEAAREAAEKLAYEHITGELVDNVDNRARLKQAGLYHPADFARSHN